MSAVTNLGKVSVTPKGTWANNTAYDILDIVAYQGSSYIAIQDVPSSGVPLSNTSYWLMIASKGDGGEITSVSASISGGYGTPGVTVTEGGTDHEKTLAFAFTNLVGLGISSITQTTTSSVSGGTNVITCTLTDGNSTTFAILNGTDGDAINIAPAYDSTATYNLGDLVVYNDTLYECTTAIPVAEAWDSTHWTATDVSGQLSKKANIDGSYDLMNTGTSDNWTPYSADSGATQDIPFINEATGGGNGESVVDTGSYLQFKKKLGNTVGVNQQFQKVSEETFIPSGNSNTTYTKTGEVLHISVNGNNTAKYAALSVQRITSLIQHSVGHKFLIGFKFVATSGYDAYVAFNTGGRVYGGTPNNYYFAIAEAASNSVMQIGTNPNVVMTTSDYVEVTDIKCIDLTLWFDGNDRIPSDLLSHPENWGRYYAGSLAYNAGTLENADGSILKSINRNCWDGEHDVTAIPNQAYYCKGTATITYKDRGGNTMSTASVTNTSFTTPADCFSFGVSGTGVTISLYYSGESGYDEDYDFSVLAEVDTGSEVLRSAGAVADEKLPDGTITRRVGYVDMGTLTWTKSSSGNKFYATVPSPYYKMVDTGTPAQCAIYINDGIGTSATGYYPTIDKAFRLAFTINPSACEIYIHDESYSDAATFKTAMSGVYLYYELATPTTEQGTAFAENIPCDDFGSLMWTQTKGIPQGNEIFYPVDYKASFDTLYNLVEGDMSAIATDDELQVVADRVPAAPDADGTYTLKATVSSGTKTYSWVADE